MSYVVVNRFTTTEDLTTGTYGTPKDLFNGITAYNGVFAAGTDGGDNYIANVESVSGINLDSDLRDSIIDTVENATYVIVDDYVSVDQTMVFDTAAHYTEWEAWKPQITWQDFDSDTYLNSRTYEDTWTKTLVSEG